MTKKIINFTQHELVEGQIKDGVFTPDNHEEVRRLITFFGKPDKDDMRQRASALASIARKRGVETAMIGGAPFFMGTLENTLKENGIKPVYAFSQRMPDKTFQYECLFEV